MLECFFTRCVSCTLYFVLYLCTTVNMLMNVDICMKCCDVFVCFCVMNNNNNKCLKVPHRPFDGIRIKLEFCATTIMASSVIYPMRPLVPDVEPLLPSSDIFYKAPHYFKVTCTPAVPQDPRMAALQARQTAVLEGLSALQATVSGALKQYGTPCGEKQASLCTAGAPKKTPFSGTTNDVVVQTCAASKATCSLATAYLLEV